MGFLSLFRPKRRTFKSNFSSYRSIRPISRKPFEPKGSPQRERKQNTFVFKAVKILKIILFLALGIGLLYLIFLTDLFKIEKIDVKGSEATLSEQTALNTSLQEHLGKNLLFFNTSLLEQDLLEQYPYLKELDVNRSFFHTVTVNLETYPNSANIEVDFEDGTVQYYTVNELGYISGLGQDENELPTIVMDVTSADIDLPEETVEPTDETLEEDSPAEVPETETAPTIPEWTLNEELIDKDMLALIVSTTADFEGRFNMQIKEVNYLKQARELHLYTERDFYIWIDLTQDTSVQLTKLKKALSILNIYEADLNYIDLRISGQNGEKVIYKLQETEE